MKQQQHQKTEVPHQTNSSCTPYGTGTFQAPQVLCKTENRDLKIKMIQAGHGFSQI